jgi:hypothetical protein
MPKGLRYCGNCGSFTRRKKQHHGRCKYLRRHFEAIANEVGYHGQPKKRVYKGNFWTHSSRKGAFGRKIWKKWFNNAAMNRLEARLGKEIPARKGNDRYEMRSLAPKMVNTRASRDSRP